MMLYGFLLFACLVYLAYGTRCVSEILKCAKLYRHFNAYKDLPETPYALDQECSLQEQFFFCVSKHSRNCYTKGYYFPLPEELERKKTALIQLCTKGTQLRERYLMGAACINRLDTSHCASEEVLHGLLDTESSRASQCLLNTRSTSCIASKLKHLCGEDVSYLFVQLTRSFEPDDACYFSDEEGDYDFGFVDYRANVDRKRPEYEGLCEAQQDGHFTKGPYKRLF